MVRYLQDTYQVSQRRACAVLNQSRATQRKRPRAINDLQRQVETRMLELVGKHPRYGLDHFDGLHRGQSMMFE